MLTALYVPQDRIAEEHSMLDTGKPEAQELAQAKRLLVTWMLIKLFQSLLLILQELVNQLIFLMILPSQIVTHFKKKKDHLH